MNILKHAATPYVAPFGVFLGILALSPHLGLSGRALALAWIAVVAGVLLWLSRPVLSFRLAQPLGSVALGVGVFVLWVAPDMLWDGYRQHWLFQNSLTGALGSSLSGAAREDTLVLVLRSLRAIVIVPIVEELFWRAFLMRWVIKPDFQSLPLGAYERQGFWIVAALFALEHGPFWDVGLLAGAIYNGWMVRTRSLGDCILAHAVTNACLCLFVVVTGRWQYWL